MVSPEGTGGFKVEIQKEGQKRSRGWRGSPVELGQEAQECERLQGSDLYPCLSKSTYSPGGLVC